VKQIRPIVATTVLLGVTLANAGVLQAVHIYEHHRVRSGDSSAADHHHDPETCPFCLQFAFGRETVASDFGAALCLAWGVVQEVISPQSFLGPNVPLPSSPARAPPSVCR
jgi:hypothetical protein